MDYQHGSQKGLNIWAKLGLTRHGWVLSKCESNLSCFKEKSAYHVFRQSCLPRAERSQQKLSMQVENMLTTGKKKNLPETPVMTPWQRRNLSTVGVYNMKAAEGLQSRFQMDPQLPRISAPPPPFLEVFAPPFSADSMGPCSWTPWKSQPKRSSCLETFTPSNIMWSHSGDTVNGPLGHLGRENPSPSTVV